MFGSNSSGFVVVVEPESIVAQILIDKGYRVLRLRRDECLKDVGKGIPRRILDGEILGICITYHAWKTIKIPEEMITKFNKEMNTWIRHAHNMKTPVVMLGLTGKHWDHVTWNSLIQDRILNETKHRLCGWNLKLTDSDKPCNLCLKVLSTRVLTHLL